MTEAEKSILHLRKRERMQRELYTRKDVKYNFVVDDFARNIEKSLASVLKKDKTGTSEDEKEEDKRGRKRKKHDRDRQKTKQKKMDSPKPDEIDENEMLNIQGCPEFSKIEDKRLESPSQSGGRSEDSYESEYSSENERGDRPERREGKKRDYKGKHKNRNKRDKKYKERSRDRRNEQNVLKDSQGVCVFYLQGKCQKNDCPYSHEAVPPMKLELCKFYLMDCCAKGDKCLYMHSDFPCKFYHTGLVCLAGDNCKFAHGKPLSDGLKQILFKHIETAPRDILGGFPRMSREEALNMINVTQKDLTEKYTEKKEGGDANKGAIPSLFDINIPVPPELADDTKAREKPEKPLRNRPSRWQETEANGSNKNNEQLKQQAFQFAYGKDQDMRISSNGDVDMRTLPPLPNISSTPAFNPNTQTAENQSQDSMDVDKFKHEPSYTENPSSKDIDIRNSIPPFSVTGDVDIRQQIVDVRLLSSKDVDIRQLPGSVLNSEDQLKPLQPPGGIDLNASASLVASALDTLNIPHSLPKMQRDLFMRIQAHQKDNIPEPETVQAEPEDMNNINWYSDDDDDDEHRLMIKVDNDDVKDENSPMETEQTPLTVPLPQIISPSSSSLPSMLKPQEVVEKLGDLSKIDISAEVTKLLSTISKQTSGSLVAKEKKPSALIRDPRQSSSVTADPRSTTSGPKVGASNSRVSTADPRLGLSDPRLAPSDSKVATADPRLASTEQRSGDPRRARNSTETQPKPEKISIYEQGGIDMESKLARDDSDLRRLDSDLRAMGRPDVDLRNLHLPFKGMQNYTPATEIDASINSHLPMSWRLHVIEIPRPDYTGLKLSISDAEKTGDPRLRKIFRLSTEEKDSPASPKESPKATTSVRVDPRLKKMEETKNDPVSMPYMQQLTMLQSSAFYQSLTSNQKLLLNQELALRADQSGSHDPVLNSLLTNLNIIPGSNIPGNQNTGGIAMSILASVTNLNTMLAGNPMAHQVNPAAILGQNPNIINQMVQNVGQPGLLGAAPGIPNMPEFPINFDPRNGGLLGNAPNVPSFQQEGPGFGGFEDEFGPLYPSDFGGNPGRNVRGFNRERRRGGGRNFNRNPGHRNNFRNRNNARTNRGHTPP